MGPEVGNMRSRLEPTAWLGALLLAGCSSAGYASPAFTPQAECERNGGWWRAEMGQQAFCEYEAPPTAPFPRPVR